MGANIHPRLQWFIPVQHKHGFRVCANKKCVVTKKWLATGFDRGQCMRCCDEPNTTSFLNSWVNKRTEASVGNQMQKKLLWEKLAVTSVKKIFSIFLRQTTCALDAWK